MVKIIELLPELEGDEMIYVQSLIKDMDEDKARNYAMAYRSKRKNPQTILLLALLGFIGVAGIQRFYAEQVGMGLLYLLTGGICLIGTIVDIVSYKRIAFEYNQRAADQLATMMRD